MSGKLYVVGTPIGNLGDFSPRAQETLELVDFIAAEDTRVTIKLLNHFQIKKPLISYHEHNLRERGNLVIQRILAGENAAVVTDAGMPAISDPGQELVAQCHENGIVVCGVPGPTAFATALALSGLPVGRFTFEGFLSMNKKSRREHLEELREEKRTMVFYEAPHKLPNTLKDLAQALGDRPLAIVREITKVYEEVLRTTLYQAAQQYGQGGLKGEIVLIIGGKPREEGVPISLEQAVAVAAGKIEEGFSMNEAAKQAAKETGMKKGDIYKCLIQEGNKDD